MGSAHVSIYHQLIVMRNLTISHPTPINIDTRKLHIVTIVYSSLNKDIDRMDVSNIILNSYFPTLEPALIEHNNTIFGRQFSVLVEDMGTVAARFISNSELLQSYSIPP